MGEEKKMMVVAFIDFLKMEIKNGQLGEEAAEGLEVAMQCLETAYETEGISPPPGTDLYKIYLDASPQKKETTEVDKKAAEEEKLKGNGLMKEANYTGAIDCYTKAINLDKKNAIYHCNRAAAYTKLENHKQAISDCKEALRIDPSYGKAYGRMGLAYLTVKDYQKAIESYEKALLLEPDNASYKTNMNMASEQLNSSQPSQPTQANPLAGLDIQNLLSNPAVMNMAQNFMQNPAMQNMFSNMMGGMGGPPPGTGLPQENDDTITNESINNPTENESNPQPPPQPGANPFASMFGGMDFNNIMNASQQVAAQLRETNPELADSLRGQFQDGQQEQPPPQPPKDEDTSPN